MNDWLSEIEDNIEEYTDDWQGYVGEEAGRMARVLRELAKYIKALKRSAYYPSLQRRLEIQILSDDARELCVAARDETKE